MAPVMGRAYPYMDLNAKYEKRYYEVFGKINLGQR
jgi:hypothetical protein